MKIEATHRWPCLLALFLIATHLKAFVIVIRYGAIFRIQLWNTGIVPTGIVYLYSVLYIMQFRGIPPSWDKSNMTCFLHALTSRLTPGLALLQHVGLEFMQSCPTKYLPKATGTAAECLGFHQQKYDKHGGYGWRSLKMRVHWDTDKNGEKDHQPWDFRFC